MPNMNTMKNFPLFAAFVDEALRVNSGGRCDNTALKKFSYAALQRAEKELEDAALGSSEGCVAHARELGRMADAGYTLHKPVECDHKDEECEDGDTEPLYAFELLDMLY